MVREGAGGAPAPPRAPPRPPPPPPNSRHSGPTRGSTAPPRGTRRGGVDPGGGRSIVIATPAHSPRGPPGSTARTPAPGTPRRPAANTPPHRAGPCHSSPARRPHGGAAGPAATAANPAHPAASNLATGSPRTPPLVQKRAHQPAAGHEPLRHRRQQLGVAPEPRHRDPVAVDEPIRLSAGRVRRHRGVARQLPLTKQPTPARMLTTATTQPWPQTRPAMKTQQQTRLTQIHDPTSKPESPRAWRQSNNRLWEQKRHGRHARSKD